MSISRKKPEALRLAEGLEGKASGTPWTREEAAAELRRLHSRITELEAQLAAAGSARKGQEIDAQFAPLLSVELECMLIDPSTHWDSAAKTLSDYKEAWEKVRPSPSPFASSVPVPPERKAIYAAIKARREANNASGLA